MQRKSLTVGDIKDVVSEYNNKRRARTAFRGIRNAINYAADPMEQLTQLAEKLPADKTKLLTPHEFHNVLCILLDAKHEKESQTALSLQKLTEKLEQNGAKLCIYQQLRTAEGMPDPKEMFDALHQCSSPEQGEKFLIASQILGSKHLWYLNKRNINGRLIRFEEMLTIANVPDVIIDLDKKQLLNLHTLFILADLTASILTIEDFKKITTIIEMLGHNNIEIDYNELTFGNRLYLLDVFEHLNKMGLLTSRIYKVVIKLNEKSEILEIINIILSLKQIFSQVNSVPAVVVNNLIEDVIHNEYKNKSNVLRTNLQLIKRIQEKNFIKSNEFLSIIVMLAFVKDDSSKFFQSLESSLLAGEEFKEINTKYVAELVKKENKWQLADIENIIVLYRTNKVMESIDFTQIDPENMKDLSLNELAKRVQSNVDSAEKALEIFDISWRIFHELPRLSKDMDDRLSANYRFLFIKYNDHVQSSDFLVLAKMMIKNYCYDNHDLMESMFKLPYSTESISALRKFFERGIVGFKESDLIKEFIHSSSSNQEKLEREKMINDLVPFSEYDASRNFNRFKRVIKLLQKACQCYAPKALKVAQICLESRLESDFDKNQLFQIFIQGAISKYIGTTTIKTDPNKSELKFKEQNEKEQKYAKEKRIETKYSFLFPQPSDDLFANQDKKEIPRTKQLDRKK